MDADAALIPAAQWALYLQAIADIEFGKDRVVRVATDSAGSAEGCFPEPSGHTIHVITAHNPGGRTVLPQDNDRAHGALIKEIRRRSLAWWPATGGAAHGGHIEASAAVAGLSDAEARELGRRFGQDAVFAWDPASWRLLSCIGDQTAARGWRATEGRAVSRCLPFGTQAASDHGA